MKTNILVIDDEPGLRKGLKKILSLKEYKVFEAMGSHEARDIIKSNDINLIYLDLKLNEEDGYTLLKKLKKEEPLIPVIILTGYGNIKSAVECLKAGAINYITKPIDKDLLLSITAKELKSASIIKENISLRQSLVASTKLMGLKSNHPAMSEVDFIIDRVKDSPATVLILGESGTGKEVTAKTIHYSGIYKNRPFISINCAALNDNLLESELFGHEKGSFTGAYARKLGRFELARNGTLFLDEIGDMSLAMQAKLLRVIQERSFERVGGIKSLPTNCRIIAASNKDLKKLMSKGKFREDLYYRLSLIVINLPPLRERIIDLEPFINLFIRKANREYDRNIKKIAPGLLKMLKEHTWPGNIRQLENVITNAVILSKDNIIKDIDLLNNQAIPAKISVIDFDYDTIQGLKQYTSNCLEKIECQLISRILNANNRNITKTAKDLKITRKTLYEKMEKYSI